MGGVLVINPRAGDERPSAEELVEEAAARGIEAHVLARGETADEFARRSAADVLGVAGGDGSLAAVAQVALERSVPFVCVPFGTRNHFARDLGLDRNDPIAALAAFDGVERRIDVGRVGERIFLNNVSFGLYARLVHRREEHRRGSEALARARAVWLTFRDRDEPTSFLLDGDPVSARVVLVANNDYRLDPLTIGERDRLDGGRLFVYIAHGVLRRSWEERSGERFTIDAAAERLRAAIDGEPVKLETPLRFSIQPRALRVLVPPPD